MTVFFYLSPIGLRRHLDIIRLCRVPYRRMSDHQISDHGIDFPIYHNPHTSLLHVVQRQLAELWLDLMT